ncbi:MAG: ATP phosphoribosyltransferase regulatory subunit [Alphaproteobacteria bacterium]
MPDALLPAGLMDGLPPDAAHEAAVITGLVTDFALRGYERVKPPLLEFEDGLLKGASTSLNLQTFRLMDPVSQRMLALRPDITGQISRIAESRLRHRARPLRLAYAGDVLQVRGNQIRPERQFVQAGVELIGIDNAAADIEVIALAVDALARAGVARLSVDLSTPTVATAVLDATGLGPDAVAETRAALDHKDPAAVRAAAGPAADLLIALLEAGGPADAAVPALGALALPPAARTDIARLAEVAAGLRARLPDLVLTVDAVENRGFEYHCGIAFTLFAPRVRGELGRGGRYLSGQAREAATGFSLYLDSVMRAVAPPEPARRLWLPSGTPEADAAAWRAQGWVTVAALAPAASPAAEAVAQHCTHILAGGAAQPVPPATDSGD